MKPKLTFLLTLTFLFLFSGSSFVFAGPSEEPYDSNKTFETIYNRVLVVEENNVFQQMLELTLDSSDNAGLKLEQAHSPEKGVEMINSSDPFSVIYTTHDFKNSKSNGIEFLKYCNVYSSTSSRILFSKTLSKLELFSMVQVGELHSFANNDLGFPIADDILSAIDIGIEYYKINCFGEFLDVSGFIAEDKLESNSQNLDKIQNNFEGTSDLDFKDRAFELNSLIALSKTVLNKISRTIARRVISEEGFAKNDVGKKALEVSNNTRDNIISLGENLIRSKQVLEKSHKRVHDTSAFTTEMDERIKRHKDELNG
ncbi:MAG: hypothetical protein ACI9UO_000739 [Nitrospinales bacterium]|jgi:hypothetical protein